MLPVSWPTSLSAFALEIPVLARLVEVAVPSNPRRITCAALAFPTTVGVVLVLVGGGGRRPPSCARPVEGNASRPAISTATRTKPDRPYFVLYIINSYIHLFDKFPGVKISEDPCCGHGGSCFSGETERPHGRTVGVLRYRNGRQLMNGLKDAQSGRTSH